jgi:hypothetical protein
LSFVLGIEQGAEFQMTEDRGRTTEDRGQRTEGRGQMTEDRGRMTDGRGRMAEDGWHLTLIID